MNRKDILKEVHEFVKKESAGFAEDDVFSNHVLNVKRHAQKLARLYHADVFVVTLAAYLHDIYHLQTHDHSVHEIKGAEFAQTYLKKFGLSQDIIDAVCACILNHRGSKGRERHTIEEQIMACADAMDHIERWAHMFYRRSREKSFAEAVEWMEAKLDRGYKKVNLPLARKLIEAKYKAAKLSLKDVEAKYLV